MEKRGIRRNKRALEMAFSTVVVLVLAIILLALIVTFFAGSFGKFKDKIGGFFSSSNVDDVVASCNNLEMQDSSYEYCCVNKTIKLSARERKDMSCSAASNQSWGRDIEKLNCLSVC